MSTELSFLQELDEILLKDPPQRHSYFQLKYFIIGKEPTLQAKMWQCIKELKSRKDSLVAIDLELEDIKDTIELLDIEIEKINKISVSVPLEEREIKVRKRQIERKKTGALVQEKDLKERKKWVEEEVLFFVETFKNISKIEPLKNYDDIDSQKDYWGQRLSQKLNLKMLTSNQMDCEMIETIMALPDEMPIKNKTIETLKLRQQSILHQLENTAKRLKVENEEN